MDMVANHRSSRIGVASFASGDRVAMAEAEADRLGARLQGGHAVILPFPASGHIAFARSLARYGVAITFLCPRHELSCASSPTCFWDSPR
jgi:hypothetical protein